MSSHKKLELSRETLRCLTSDLPSDRLMDVRGGGDGSVGTRVTCLECKTTVVTTIVAPTLIETECWVTRR